MMWLILALFSSLLLGFYDISKKHALRANSAFGVLLVATGIGSLPFLAILLKHSLTSSDLSLSLTPLLHVQVFLKALLMLSSWAFAFVALKHLPISLAAPIRSSAPGWTILGAVAFLGERLNPAQWLGVTVTFCSLLGLAWVGKKESIHFHRNRWVGFALIATLLGSTSALYDKFLLAHLAPLPLQCWVYVYLDLLLLLGWGVLSFFPPKHFPPRLSDSFEWRFSIPLIGLLLALSDWVYFNALAQEGALISLISVIRRSNVVVSFLLGSLIFGDLNRRLKAVPIFGIILGITLIAFSSKH